MSLPLPIPDDPRKWEGWNQYRSSNLYDRLCLDWQSGPSDEQIEDHCRLLLIWWQKKLPLKNQPSNPIAQMLRTGLDEAPMYLTEARSKLLDPDTRAQIDEELRSGLQEALLQEIRKFLEFSVSGGRLSVDAEQSLVQYAREVGLAQELVRQLIVELQAERGFVIDSEAPPEPEPEPEAELSAPNPETSTPSVNTGTQSPAEELLRILRMANIEDSLSPEQEQTFIGMGMGMGMTEEEAEKVVEAFSDELIFGPGGVPAPPPKKRSIKSGPGDKKTETDKASSKKEPEIVLTAAEERAQFQPFTNELGIEMRLVPSSTFKMGSAGRPANPNEAPVTQVKQTRFYLARTLITNAQYEQFDPAHKAKRAPWADDHHPVVYVSHGDAVKFCQWLGKKENRKYRLPTEAEWELAARGTDGRPYPWGEDPTLEMACNFADARSKFAWSDRHLDCGYAQSSPVGAFPRGASPFGILDMAGNVHEWVNDYFDNYKGGIQKNPKGPNGGTKRVYRGGSWRTRILACRTTARAFNSADYQFNDLGFRVACDCPPPAKA